MAGPVISKAVPKLLQLVQPSIPRSKANFGYKQMENIMMEHKLLSIPTTAPRNVGNVGGERSYMMLGSLAKLERALSRWAMDELISKHNFTPVVVPNILNDDIIERCGFPTKSFRSQVYKISGTNEESMLDGCFGAKIDKNKSRPCIAGTSEFALASIHIGDSIPFEELPKKYCAVSRCYRAEASRSASEWGIYRVHYFNKVEMLAFTMPETSGKMHDEFLDIQKDLFSQLNLHFRILEMPENDLGPSAAKKYDIEAWMMGRQRFGEITSTSNCQDYQSSRLNIKYSKMVESNNQLHLDSGYVHTVNGTACSTVRTLIALIEQHQNDQGRVDIPEPLVHYMNGIRSIPTIEDERLLGRISLYPERKDSDTN